MIAVYLRKYLHDLVSFRLRAYLHRQVRAGIGELRAYFAHRTRPAAILILLEGLNDPHFIATYGERLESVILAATPIGHSPIKTMTPLGRLQSAMMSPDRQYVDCESLRLFEIAADNGQRSQYRPQSQLY